MIQRKQFPLFLAPYCIAFERSAGAVVFSRNEDHVQYLVIKYRNGHWEFPRGKVEVGETDMQTAQREITEETGITDICFLSLPRMTMRFSYRARGAERIERIRDGNCMYIYKKAIFYIAQTRTPTVTLSQEHKDFRWLPYNDALEILTFDNARCILRRTHSALAISEGQKS